MANKFDISEWVEGVAHMEKIPIKSVFCFREPPLYNNCLSQQRLKPDIADG